MLQVLVESRATRPRHAAWTTFSFVAHCTALVGAILLTTRAAPDAPQIDPLPDVVYLAPQPAPEPATHSTAIGTPAPLALSHPVFTVPAIVAPSLDALAPDFFSRLIEDLSRTTVGTITRRNAGGGVAPGGVHTAETVDHMVTALPDNPRPVYPARLLAARIEGDVSVEFVVDTTGRVEESSVEILQASHALFGEAVKQWLKQTRYTPATAHGRFVRQRVRQRVGFTLSR